MAHIFFRILPRMLFWSRLTPFFVLMCAGVFLFASYFDTEPTEANIVSAFAGYETRHSARGPYPGISKIKKQKCSKVVVPEGHLCSVSYLLKRSPNEALLPFEQVHFIFPVEGGQWGQLLWNKQAQASVAEAQASVAGHQFWLLVLYTAASVLTSVLLSAALPRVAWSNSAMYERATPYVGRSAWTNNTTANRLTDGITDGANSITPAAAVGIFALVLGVAGFYLGGLVVPEALINLRYAGATERFFLLTCGISWGAVGMRLPMLFVQIASAGLVLAICYAVVVLPVIWVIGGDSPGQTLSRHTAAVESYLTFDNRGQSSVPRKGFEGYSHLFDW